MDGVKAGSATSEHKLEWKSTLVSMIVVALPVLMDAMDKGSPYYIALAMVLACMFKFSSMAYTKARSIVKVAASDAVARVDPT